MLSIAISQHPLAHALSPLARSAISIRLALQNFKKEALQLVDCLLTVQHAALFRTSRTSDIRLSCLGLSSRLPSTLLVPFLPIHAHFPFVATLLSLHKPLNKMQLHQLRCQQLHVVPGPVCLKGSFKWSRNIAMLASALCNISLQSSFLQRMTCKHVFFQCPHQHGREAFQAAFSVIRPSKPVWCRECKKSYGGRLWNCPCGTPWHSCPQHFTSVPVGVLRPKKRKSRVIPMHSREHSDEKRLKLEPPMLGENRLHFNPSSAIAKKFPNLTR